MNQIPTTRPVRLDVQFTVLHPDKSPAAGVPIRVVLGTAGDWQAPTAGIALITDADGTVQLTAPVVLESRRRPVPSGFFARLMATREMTRQLQFGLALEYAGRHWLSAISVDRRAGGASARLDPMRVFGRASDGRYTDDVPLHDGTWHKRLPTGKVAALPGFTVLSTTLDPDPTADPADYACWRLRATVQQWEPYVVSPLDSRRDDARRDEGMLRG
ncbi:MAG: hypothetical protein P3C10_03185 [Gemmatimonadota bacterium]|nr:hypothetical protein [Gemmatimonadota bacterium]